MVSRYLLLPKLGPTAIGVEGPARIPSWIGHV